MNSYYDLKIFKWIDVETVDSILSNCKTEKYKNWEMILVQWSESNWKWYIIEEWWVVIEINWNEVATLWKGDIFWEIALLNEETRTATVIASKDIELLVLSQEDLLNMMNHNTSSINDEIVDRITQNLKFWE